MIYFFAYKLNKNDQLLAHKTKMVYKTKSKVKRTLTIYNDIK